MERDNAKYGRKPGDRMDFILNHRQRPKVWMQEKCLYPVPRQLKNVRPVNNNTQKIKFIVKLVMSK